MVLDRRPDRHWTDADVAMLKVLVKDNTPTRTIAIKLARSEDAICAKAAEMGILLRPTN